MASPSTHPVPEKWVYSSAFIALDAALIGLAAVERLLLAKNEQATHAIVYHEGGFYLFNAADLLLHLLGSSEQARRRSNLRTLLDLQGSRQSPTVTEHEAPVPGSVVVRDGKAVGFVSMPDPAAGTLPALDFEHGVPVVVGAWPPLHRGYIDDIFKNRAENPGFDVRSSPTAASPVGGARVDGEEQPEDFSPAPTAPRFFNARTNNRVALNAQTYVIVQVAGEAAQPSFDSDASNVPFGDFIGSLTIDVYAPGLKADGPTTLTLQVPAGGDSAKVRFAFIAQKSGHQKIEVMAWNGSAQVAGVTLHVAVETDPVVAAPHEVTGDLKLREPEIGEYTLDVAMESDTRRYRFQLRSDQRDVWPPMYSESLLNARQHTYHTTIANLNAQARNLYGLKMEDQAIWLRGMGTLLFEQLVPDTLKALLIERKSKIRVLNILSEADPTPWELLFLADPETGDGEFLGASATVARWRYGAGPSRSLRRATKVLVLPDDAPPEAQAEMQNLRTLLGGADTIGDLSSLNTLMTTGGFDLLHFAAHNVNVPNAQAGAYVPFGPRRWDLTFMAAVPRNKFKARAPLVFMNACTTSGTTELYTELASWADRFLSCGSGAFIGTLWEVRDSSARQFSEVFYSELLQGQTLGEAMQTARAKLHAISPGDPTPLAYTLYGNPLARLEQA